MISQLSILMKVALSPMITGLTVILTKVRNALPERKARAVLEWEQMWAWVKQKRKEWRLDCVDTLFFYFLWLCGDL